MTARQPVMDKLVEQQQETALILERVQLRMDIVEKWQQNEDRAKEREEERRDGRDDRQPDQLLGKIALAISAGGFLIYLLTTVAQHWH